MIRLALSQTISEAKESSNIKVSIHRQHRLSAVKRQDVLMGEVIVPVQELFTSGCDKVGAYLDNDILITQEAMRAD